METLSATEILRDPHEQTEAVREAAAEGLSDFRVFVTQIMNFNGSIPGMPDYTDPGYDPLFEIIPDIEEKDTLIELPRGCGKTTLMSELYPLWCGLRDPNDTILLVHAKHAVACRWISTIKSWMLGGYREPGQPGSDLRAVYGPLGMLPPLGAKQWGKVEALDFPGRTVKFDETTVMASGMDNIVTGGHWSKILSDDLINRENFRSPELLRQAHEWWQLTRGLGRGKKRRVVIGTRWNSADLLGVIEDEQKALVAKGEPATKTICILPARHEDGRPRFKHKDDAELQKDFIEMGPSIYAGQMDLRPVADGLQPLKEEYFKPFYNIHDVGRKTEDGRFKVHEDFHVAIFVDLAASLKEGRDRTAIIVRASDPRGHIFVLEAVAGQWLPAEAFARIVMLQRKYSAQYVGCEKGPLRAAYEGFLVEWNKDHRASPLFFADIEIGGGKGGNNDRILSLEPFAVQRMIHLLPDQTELLYELCLYPNGKRDDLCFVAGTKVALERGEVPIEDVRVGDRAWTREGLRPVIAAGMTADEAEVRTVALDDGTTVTGTPNHPVWVDGRGFVSLADVAVGDILMSCQGKRIQTSEESRSSTRESSSGGIPMPSVAPTGFTTGLAGHTSRPGSSTYTKKSTRTTTGRFLPALSSTTKTETPATTTLATSSPWGAEPISRNTGIVGISTQRSSALTCERSVTWPPRGTGLPKERRGIAYTESRLGRNARSIQHNAPSAANSSSPTSLRGRDTALLDAGQSNGSEFMDTQPRNRESARSARSYSTPKPRGLELVARSVLGSFDEPTARTVYNLSVARTPEFFANGILVHNCDTLAQAVHNPFRPRVKKKREPVYKSNCDEIMDLVMSRSKPAPDGVLA